MDRQIIKNTTQKCAFHHILCDWLPSPHSTAVQPTYLYMAALIILYLFKDFKISRYGICMVDYIIWSNCHVFSTEPNTTRPLSARGLQEAWPYDLLWQIKYDWKWLCNFWIVRGGAISPACFQNNKEEIHCSWSMI